MTTSRPTYQDAPPLVIDTRERAPWRFGRETVTKTLHTGDYSIVGMEADVAVERKELGDFLNCTTHARDRFERELERSWAMRRLWVVVEGTLRAIAAGEFRSAVEPEAVLGTIAAWENRFDRVRLVFAGDRPTAARIAEKLLLRSWLDWASGRVF